MTGWKLIGICLLALMFFPFFIAYAFIGNTIKGRY